LGIRDAARKDKIDGGVEVAGVFQKERTLFRKENFKSLVDRRFAARPTQLEQNRIDRGVEDKPVFETIFESRPARGSKLFPKKVRFAAGTIVQCAKRTQRAVGDELDVAAGRNVAHAVHLSLLA